MKLSGCINSHFIRCIKDGEVKKVHNVDSQGRPGLKFKKLEDIHQSKDARITPMPFAERKTRARNGYIVEEDEPNCPSNENSFDELTLSQLKKKCKRKKRKASESVLLTPKADDDDSDLSEPLCKFRVEVSKTSRSKSMPANGTSSTSSKSNNKDIATVNVKVEVPDVEYFECREITHMADNSQICNGHVRFIASESGFVIGNLELKNIESESGSSTNEGEICGFNEVSYDGLDDIKNMELDSEENMENVNQPPLNLISMEDDSSLENLTASTSFCSESQQVNHISGVQDSDSTIDDDHYVDLGQGSPRIQEYDSPSPMPDYLCLPWKSTSWSSPDDHDDDVDSTKAKSPIPEENHDDDVVSLNSDNSSFVSEDISSLPLVPINADSEVKLSNHENQTDVTSETSEIKNSDSIEIRQPERLPLTRKAISPNSQEKLCQAMKDAELLDDLDHYKCKEKLNFGEQTENKFSSNKPDVEDNEPNVHLPQQPTQFIQNKVIISPKHMMMLKRTKNNYKKGSPPNGCLDGPRLCRSLPHLSTGCTSIQGCSESAIAFSQRQMHDIESLASKLMSELNSMKAIVEEKLLYEAYRSTSLKNEADEVKSSIKSATKTEETARKWLSMMARDCNRFCKIMKQNKDDNTSASAPAAAAALGSPNQEKPAVQRERKKISFADEAGGTLCDIKVYQIDDCDPLESKESSLS